MADGLAYVTMQELATKISHRNTGRLLEDKVGYEVMARVAGDEQLHHVFYRDAACAALEVDPDGMVMAIDRQVRTFAMPGTGIPDFGAHAKRIAKAQIYDFQIHHDLILRPMVIDTWKLPELEGLSPEADEARDHGAEVPRPGRLGRQEDGRPPRARRGPRARHRLSAPSVHTAETIRTLGTTHADANVTPSR